MEIKLDQTLENNCLWTIPILSIRKVKFEKRNTYEHRIPTLSHKTLLFMGKDTRKKEELFEVPENHDLQSEAFPRCPSASLLTSRSPFALPSLSETAG